MNIHFKDKDIFNKLVSSTIVKIEVGSGMYNLKTEDSDTDYLMIYANAKDATHSFYFEHHQFQYKDNGTDYVFTTLQQYIRNILTGDSTINYEALFSEEMKTDLEWLHSERLKFRNYNILKSYLGLANRDIKAARNMLKGNIKTLSKKLSHIYRGLYSVDLIMNGNYYTNRLDIERKDDYDYLLSLKNSSYLNKGGSAVEFLDYADNYMNQLKENLLKSLASHKVATFMRPDHQEIVDKKLMEYCQSEEYISKQCDSIIIKEIYQCLEHGINYGG